jgi:hypothetical protein
MDTVAELQYVSCERESKSEDLDFVAACCAAGVLHAILDYCTKIMAISVIQYRNLRRKLPHMTSQPDTVQARKIVTSGFT